MLDTCDGYVMMEADSLDVAAYTEVSKLLIGRSASEDMLAAPKPLAAACFSSSYTVNCTAP